MWTVKWWKDVGERAIRTFIASFGAWLTVASSNVGIDQLNWLRGLALAGIATIISIAASIGTHSVTGNGPSFTSVYKDKNIDPPTVPAEIVNNKHVRGNDGNPRY